jgi:hypothetical protein
MIVDNQMALHHGFDLEYLDNLIPWQRQIHVELVAKFVKEENERVSKSR